MNGPDFLWLSLGGVAGSFGAYGVAYGAQVLERLVRRYHGQTSSEHHGGKHDSTYSTAPRL